MTAAKAPKPRAPRKPNIKTPGTNEPTPLDPAQVPPEVNTTDKPKYESIDPEVRYVMHKTPVHETGRVMGNHVLTENGWVRED